MLDYTNLFYCECGALLPFGTKKCPHCSYEFTNPEKEEKARKKRNLIILIGFLWFILAPSLMQIPSENIAAHLLISLLLPTLMYTYHLKTIVKNLEKQSYKIEFFDSLVEKHKGGDTNLDKYFGKIEN